MDPRHQGALLVDWLNTPLFTLLLSDGEVSPFTPLRLLGLVLIAGAVWLLAWLAERTIHDFAKRRPQSESTTSLVYAWTRIFRYTIWIVGTILGLGYLGFDLKNLAFLGTTIGVGVGFGLQNIFSNFISGVIVLLEGTLKIRDYVELQSGVRGTVREIGLRFTRIHTNDGVDVLVPNSEFINTRVTNWTFLERTRRQRVKFGVPHGTDKELVRELGMRVVKNVPHVIIDADHPVEVRLVGFTEGAVEFELVFWVGPARVDRLHKSHAETLWIIDDELRAANIAIPRAQRELYLRDEAICVSLQDKS